MTNLALINKKCMLALTCFQNASLAQSKRQFLLS